MVQVWILDRSNSPSFAYKEGLDVVVCGDCKRSSKGNDGDGSCYVNVAWAPNAVWKAYKKREEELHLKLISNKKTPDRYERYLQELGRDKDIRLGAYGDPAFIGIPTLDNYLMYAKSYTGYTHQWNVANDKYKKYLMASVDNIWEAKTAQKAGWRTFRVYKEKDQADKTIRKKLNEAFCPSSKESGQKVQCISCPNSFRCDGQHDFFVKKNIVIKEH